MITIACHPVVDCVRLSIYTLGNSCAVGSAVERILNITARCGTGCHKFLSTASIGQRLSRRRRHCRSSLRNAEVSCSCSSLIVALRSNCRLNSIITNQSGERCTIIGIRITLLLILEGHSAATRIAGVCHFRSIGRSIVSAIDPIRDLDDGCDRSCCNIETSNSTAIIVTRTCDSNGIRTNIGSAIVRNAIVTGSQILAINNDGLNRWLLYGCIVHETTTRQRDSGIILCNRLRRDRYWYASGCDIIVVLIAYQLVINRICTLVRTLWNAGTPSSLCAQLILNLSVAGGSCSYQFLICAVVGQSFSRRRRHCSSGLADREIY